MNKQILALNGIKHKMNKQILALNGIKHEIDGMISKEFLNSKENSYNEMAGHFRARKRFVNLTKEGYN